MDQVPQPADSAIDMNGESTPLDLSVLSKIRSCAACFYSAKEGQDRVCRIEPPSVFMFLVPMQSPIRPGMQGIAPKSFTQFPVVADDQWCGKFSPRMLRK